MSLSLMQKKNLETQGFRCESPDFENARAWLRLNPIICFAIAVIGFLMESATVFFALSGIAAVGAFLPHSPGDLLYNYVLRYMVQKPALPSNPPPRRFACFVGMLWSLGIAFSFIYAHLALAYALSISFFLVVIPMFAVHYCIASVIYQKIIGFQPN